MDLGVYFSLAALILSALGVSLAYRITMRKPRWLDSLFDKYVSKDERGEWKLDPKLEKFLMRTTDAIALHFIKMVKEEFATSSGESEEEGEPLKLPKPSQFRKIERQKSTTTR